MAALVDGKARLVVVLLCNNVAGNVLNDMIGEIKAASKSIGSHKRRELYWEAYTKLGNLALSTQETLYGFLTFHLAEDDEDASNGKAEYVPATKRQRGLMNSVDFFGKKYKPEDALTTNEWFLCWFDDDAAAAYADITNGEPVVYLSQDQDGVFIGTKLKRKKCRAAPSAALKSPADVAAFKATLQPDSPLCSVSWLGNEPPKLNDYNFLLAGGFAKAIAEDPALKEIHVKTTSTDEIYAAFTKQRNGYFLTEAEKLLEVMHREIGKGEANPLVNTSVKMASIARTNGLMKKVFVDAGKKKFIEAVRAEGDGIEMFVVEGAPDGCKFMDYGGVVFELHYRADLNMFL